MHQLIRTGAWRPPAGSGVSLLLAELRGGAGSRGPRVQEYFSVKALVGSYQSISFLNLPTSFRGVQFDPACFLPTHRALDSHPLREVMGSRDDPQHYSLADFLPHRTPAAVPFWKEARNITWAADSLILLPTFADVSAESDSITIHKPLTTAIIKA